MPAKAKAPSPAPSPASQVAGWARQGIESFVAAQKIFLDLTAQQNALVIGMVREHLSKPIFRPGDALAKIGDKGVKNFTAAGKILLDLAAGETALVVHGVKEVVPLPVAARTLADVVRHRVDAFVSMQKRLMDAARDETHALAESYQEGRGLMVGASLAEVARRGIEGFVETEKKFLDLAAHEVTAATKDGKEVYRPSRDRLKVLTQLARQAVEKYIEAQKKLLDLALDQWESTGKATGKGIEDAREEARTSWGKLTQKSVHNIVTAQKSLMDLAVKPLRASATEKTRRNHRVRPRRKKQIFEQHEAA